MIYKSRFDLSELLTSLNKSQRLLLSRKWSKPPYNSYLYVHLYHLLLKDKSYSPEQLCAQIPQLKLRQLNNVQNELYLKILEALRSHQKPTYSEKYQELVKNYLVLSGLNLPQQANKWKIKAIDFKTNHEEICDAEYINEEIFYREGIEKDIYFPENIHIEKGFDDLLSSYRYFRNFYLDTRFSKNKKEYKRLEYHLGQTIGNLDLDNLKLAEQILYARLMYHYNYIQRNFINCYKYASALVRIYEKTGLHQTYSEWYIKFTNYQLTSLFRLNAHSRYVQLIQRFRSIHFEPSLPNINRLREMHFIYELTHSLNLTLIQGDFKEGIHSFKLREEHFNTINKRHNMAFISGIYYKIACLYFGAGDFKKCIVYLDKIIFKSEISARPDLHIFSRILKLTALFELNETPYIFENIRSVYSYLARNKQLDNFLIEIMQFLRICARIPESEVQNEFVKLRTRMSELARDRFEQRAFYYFDIISWLDSKLEHKSLSEIIKERGLGHRILS